MKTMKRKVSQKFPRRLTENDICKHLYSDELGRHCSLGWIGMVGTPGKSEMMRREMFRETGKIGISIWNDSHQTKKTAVAKTINRVLKKLGWIK